MNYLKNYLGVSPHNNSLSNKNLMRGRAFRFKSSPIVISSVVEKLPVAPGFPLQSLTQSFSKIFLAFSFLLLISCSPKQQWVDLIVYNANIYTVDSAFSIKQSMAISAGKIVAIGTDEEIKTKYNSSTLLDANHKTIFPGFIDAHCHFLGYGLGLQRADLIGTKSFEEVLKRLPSP